MNQPKYRQVADRIRAEVTAGVLKPGEAVRSGAALARETGYSTLTCRRALQVLISEGVLISGLSRNARARVPSPPSKPGEQASANAARDLSASLAARRRAGGLKQPELAARIGVSITTIGHAETGRLWQSRRFWEQADKALDADGELLALHDAYRAAALPAHAADAMDNTETASSAVGIPPPAAVAATNGVTCVTITWADGTATTVYPPGTAPDKRTAFVTSWPICTLSLPRRS